MIPHPRPEPRVLVVGSINVDLTVRAVRVGAYACTGRGAQPSYPTGAGHLPAAGEPA